MKTSLSNRKCKVQKLTKILFFIFILWCSQFSLALEQYKIKTILLVVAMQEEAQPIITKLKLKPSSISFHGLPMKAYTGKFANFNINLIWNGEDPIHKVPNMGSEAATLTTYLGIEQFHPDLIISIGTAGGIAKKNSKPGDIYLSKKIYFYYRRLPAPIEYYEYGIGGYPSYPLKNDAHMKEGIVCSGGAIDHNKPDHDMYLKLNCDAIEMEAAGVAWISSLKHIPMVAIKGVTNNVEDLNDAEEFDKNLPFVSNKLAQTLQQELLVLAKKSAQ